MGDFYHGGQSVGSGIGINDDAIERYSTWSSEKIDGEITLSKVYKMGISSFSSLPLTINNDYNIKSNMVVVNSVLSNPAAQTSDWTVTPNSSGGSLTISGSINGSTALTLYLEESQSDAVIASVIKKQANPGFRRFTISKNSSLTVTVHNPCYLFLSGSDTNYSVSYCASNRLVNISGNNPNVVATKTGTYTLQIVNNHSWEVLAWILDVD